MNTNTETTMSPAEALEVIKRAEMMMPLGTVARAVWFEDAANARTAVAALIEREAALAAALRDLAGAMDTVLLHNKSMPPGDLASRRELVERAESLIARAEACANGG